MRWNVFLFLLLLPIGCLPPGPDAAAPLPQAGQLSWEEQVVAVRERRSMQIQQETEPVTEPELRMLLEGCAALRILEVHQGAASLETMREVLQALPELERLKLTGPVSDDLLRIIAEVPTLTILNLPRGEFGNDGLRALADPHGVDSGRPFGIHHPSGLQSEKTPSRLSASARLELLRFHSPHVTNEGLQVVRELPRLRFLHLIDVPITDAGLVHLYGLDNLESFYLDGSECTEEGLSELIKQLPNLHFHWNQLHLPNDPHRHPH
jgi:hypothetical protein